MLCIPTRCQGHELIPETPPQHPPPSTPLFFPLPPPTDLQTFCHQTLLPACHSFMQKHADAKLSCWVRWPELKERGNGSKHVAVAFWCQISGCRLLSPFTQYTKRFKPTNSDAAAYVPSLQRRSHPRSSVFHGEGKESHLTTMSCVVLWCYHNAANWFAVLTFVDSRVFKPGSGLKSPASS